MEKMKFTVLGGDERSLCLAYSLTEDENQVKIFGFDNKGEKLGVEESPSLKEAIKDADVIIGPLPLSKDGRTINAPFYTGEIEISEVVDLTDEDQLLTVGKIDSISLELFNEKNIEVKDYFAREEMQILNAIPTAEGAIGIAMGGIARTIYGSNVLVLGYGRIGKVLSNMLQGLGANVYVAARKCSDLAWIKASGYNPIFFGDIWENLYRMNLVFNTVPAMTMNQYMLKELDKEAMVIDLASKPGGVDFEKAEELGVKVNWALALPGKVAPITAAEVIKEAIYNIVREWGDRSCF